MCVLWVDRSEFVVRVTVADDRAFRRLLYLTMHPTFPLERTSFSRCTCLVPTAMQHQRIIHLSFDVFHRRPLHPSIRHVMPYTLYPTHWWTKKILTPFHLDVHPTPESIPSDFQTRVPMGKSNDRSFSNPRGREPCTWNLGSEPGRIVLDRAHSAWGQAVTNGIVHMCGLI